MRQVAPDNAAPKAQNPSLGTSTVIASHAESAKKRTFRLQTLAAKLLPDWKVAKCLRVPTSAGAVEVARRDSHAYFRNLVVCDRPWQCPYCAQRISNRRRDELGAALVNARLRGLTPVVVAFTLQHHRTDTCADNVNALNAALRRLFAGRSMAFLREEFGLVASVRNLEVTFGVNGWHTHSHMLLFLDLPGHDPNGIKNALQNHLAGRWIAALEKEGYTATEERGVFVQVADGDIAEYVAKFGREPDEHWGAADELGRAPAKRAARDGLTPFQLLEAYGTRDKATFLERYGAILRNRKQAGALFREYADAFKTKHQLQWSRGAKDLLGVNETPAVEAEETAEAETVLTLETDAWARIVDADLRADLLDMVAAGDDAALWRWLALLGIQHIDLKQFSMRC